MRWSCWSSCWPWEEWASYCLRGAAAAAGVAEHIQEAGVPVPPPDSDVPSQAGVQLAVYTASSDALVGEPRETPPWLLHYPDPVTDLEVTNERVRVVVLPAMVNGQTVAWVAAGRSMLPEDRLLHRVRWLLLAGAAVAVVVSLGAGSGSRPTRPTSSARRSPSSARGSR